MPTSWLSGVAMTGHPSSRRTSPVSASTSSIRCAIPCCSSWARSVPSIPPGTWWVTLKRSYSLTWSTRYPAALPDAAEVSATGASSVASIECVQPISSRLRMTLSVDGTDGPLAIGRLRRMQHVDALAYGLDVGEPRRAHEVVRVELHRLAAGRRDDLRDQRAQPVDVQHPGGVVEEHAVDLRHARRSPPPCRQVARRVDRGLAEEHGPDDLGAVFLGDARQPREVLDAVEDVVDPVRAHAVLVEAPHPQVHQRGRRDAERHGGVAAHAAAHRRAADRAAQQVEPLPRVLAAVLDQHLHERAGGRVDDLEARAVEHVGDGQRHAGLHAHPPQALLAVADRLVQQLDAGHRAPSAARASVWRSRSDCLSTLPAALRGSSATTTYSFGRLCRPIAPRQRASSTAVSISRPALATR